MILTISTTHRPATDLGFLLHKNPERHQIVDLSFGTAHVLYPEASEERCSASLLVEIDPVGLVRNRRGPSGNDFSLGAWVGIDQWLRTDASEQCPVLPDRQWRGTGGRQAR